MTYIVFHMVLERKTLVEAGRALAVLREYQRLPLEHPDKLAFAAAMASFTAGSMGGTLHTYSDDTQFTLLVSEWTESSFPSAVLITNSVSDWAAAVAFWCISNQNLFRINESFDTLEDIDRMIMKSTYELWLQTPKGSPVRWAEAARIYDDSGLAYQEGSWNDDGDFENWNNSLTTLTPKLLDVLGYDSVLQIWPEYSYELFPTGPLQEVLIAESYDDGLTHMAYTCIAKPLPKHIPIEVLRNRGELSPAQALAFYLVDEEYGPKLTYATAANMLGMKNRQEIGTHLKRARDILKKSGHTPKLSGLIHYEYPLQEAPKAFEISIVSSRDKKVKSLEYNDHGHDNNSKGGEINDEM